MRPIAIFNDDRVPEDKIRRIEVYKQAVYDDIDALTYKWQEMGHVQAPEQRNAVSSDTSERLDGKVLSRNVEFRDAQLRRFISFALADMHEVFQDDITPIMDDSYHYILKVDRSFNDNLLNPLSEYFHRFLCWGALYDWYGSLGLGQQAAYYKNGLDEIEAGITNMLRSPSIAKRPMQPFGPARFP